MIQKFIEVTNGFNWGKFMVSKFDSEFAIQSEIDQRPLFRSRGWTHKHILVLDLQTGEGAMFFPGGSAVSDLNKHSIWVCPMYEPFLQWLYKQDLDDISKLPSVVNFTMEETAQHTGMAGYRREGSLAR